MRNWIVEVMCTVFVAVSALVNLSSNGARKISKEENKDYKDMNLNPPFFLQ